MEITEIVMLRLVHVIGGAVWVGFAVFTTAFLQPAMGEAGPAAGAVMAGLQKRKLMVFLPIVAGLTLLSGIRLLWIISGGFAPAYLASTRGLTFMGAGGLAIVAFLMGIFISRPAMVRSGALAQRAAASEGADRDRLLKDAQALRERAGKIGFWVTILLLLAVAGMAVGRYV